MVKRLNLNLKTILEEIEKQEKKEEVITDSFFIKLYEMEKEEELKRQKEGGKL